MPATLKGVSLIAIDLGEEHPTNLIAVRVIISGMFSDVSNYASIMRKVFAENLNGAVFSSGVRCNFYQAPSNVEVSPLNQYSGLLQTTYGNDDGFKITTLRTTQPLKGTNQVNSVQSTSGNGLTYKGVRCCTVYNGGFSGHSNQICLNPVVIITDEDYNVYAQPSSSFMVGVVSEYATLGISEDDILPLPVISWHHDVFTDEMFDSIPTSYINSISLSQVNIQDDIKNEYPVGPAGDDPYGPGGYSGGDESSGDFDFTGSPQPLGPVPSWVKDGLDTGFYTLYNPSSAELRNLASYLWSNNFDLDLLKKLFNNPMDLILNFGVVPCPIESGGSKEVGIGLISTGIYMNTAANRNIHLEFGPVTINRAYSAYLDYAPYTRFDLILPFVGVVPVDTDAIMNKTIYVVYNIDILTGACVAGINAGGHCIGEYAGNCMRPLPLTGADYSNMIGSLIQTAGAIAAGVATGGGAGAVAGGLGAASSAIVNEGKPMIEKGGAISSAAGYLGHLKPTIIASIPHQCVATSQISEEGYPSFVTGQIKNVRGFAQVYEVHLDNIHATSAELDEIEALLKGGFYAN